MYLNIVHNVYDHNTQVVIMPYIFTLAENGTHSLVTSRTGLHKRQLS